MIAIPEDKKKHFVVSLLLMLMLSLVHVPLVWAAAITLVVGVAKEIYDKYCKKTYFDVYDLLADIIGIGVGFILCYLFL
jgi:VanZ family protein